METVMVILGAIVAIAVIVGAYYLFKILLGFTWIHKFRNYLWADIRRHWCNYWQILLSRHDVEFYDLWRNRRSPAWIDISYTENF